METITNQNLLQVTEFTEIENVVLEPNCVFLLKCINTERKKCYQAVNVGRCKNTECITSVKTLLATLIANEKEIDYINNISKGLFESGKNGVERKAMINRLNSYLKTHVLYRTNNVGKLETAAISEVTLNNTLLRIRDNMKIFSLGTNNDKFKLLLHQQATVILRQMSFVSNVVQNAERLFGIDVEGAPKPKVEPKVKNVSQEDENAKIAAIHQENAKIAAKRKENAKIAAERKAKVA